MESSMTCLAISARCLGHAVNVRFSASVGSSFSPAMRRFSGIVVAVVGIVAATIAVVQLSS